MSTWDEIGMTPDEQEALSRRYSNDIIILLPLRSGNIAVFNNESRKLCGIVAKPCEGEKPDEWYDNLWYDINQVWQKPAEAKPPSTDIDLKELGLL